ncbi:hypothetical protein RPHASCH2410_PD01445 (plasmid) [Rhizobium phaseoli Ch24-10]|nr:hypothetical protein RPHASCH2410_PD01445 [Rhizobium phaseoli Ch24-10]
MFLPMVIGPRELHPKTSEDFLPGVALGVQVYDPSDEALMIWKNLQLIACIDDDRLEGFEVVKINRQIRKQAQFIPSQTEVESVIRRQCEVIARPLDARCSVMARRISVTVSKSLLSKSMTLKRTAMNLRRFSTGTAIPTS